MDKYRRKLRLNKIFIFGTQILVLISFFLLWEVLVDVGVLNEFIVSKPSAIYDLFIDYMDNGDLLDHISISLYEAIIGLVIGTSIGVGIAILLWWNRFVAKVLDPFLVVLNALPKTALAPIFIIWVGTGVDGIITVAISLLIIMTIMSSYNAFISVEEEKIKMMRAYGANKLTIFRKLIFPSSIPSLLNVLKINIGMSWVGVIVGEFIVSRKGIGYLVVYGGQVFRLDLVMMGVMILSIIAMVMYLLVALIERIYKRRY